MPFSANRPVSRVAPRHRELFDPRKVHLSQQVQQLVSGIPGRLRPAWLDKEFKHIPLRQPREPWFWGVWGHTLVIKQRMQ